jgi:hypothetical protein
MKSPCHARPKPELAAPKNLVQKKLGSKKFAAINGSSRSVNALALRQGFNL